MTAPTATEHRDATAPAPRHGTRSTWAIVARREVQAKLADRTFLVGSAVMLALIAGFIGFQAWMDGRTETHEVAVTAPAAASMVDQAAREAAEDDDGVALERVELPDEAAARAAVHDEEVDAWLHADPDGGWVLLTRDAADGSLERVLSATVRDSTLARNATEAGTTVEALTAGSEIVLEQTNGDPQVSQLRDLLGFAFAFLFYVASIMFGMTLATSVVEEKQSRIVEIIAAAVPLRQLLAGKVVGNTVLALAQMVLYIAVAMVGLSFTDFSHLLPSLSGEVGWFLVFFVVGFLALSCAWSVAGALASRNEDLQSTSAPITILLVGIFFGSLFLDGRAAAVASYVPPMSAIVMPQRMLAGTAAWWEPFASLVLLLAAAAVLVLAAERVYRRALLQTGGKLGLRQAWHLEE